MFRYVCTFQVERSRYALYDKFLNDTLTSTGRHVMINKMKRDNILNELTSINKQLNKLNKISCGKSHANTGSRQEEQSDQQQHPRSTSNEPVAMPPPDDYTYLKRIRAHKEHLRSSKDKYLGMGALSLLVDFKKFIMKHDLNVKKVRDDLFDAKIELEESAEKLKSFHYINTLENLKTILLNPRKWKLKKKNKSQQQQQLSSTKSKTHR